MSAGPAGLPRRAGRRPVAVLVAAVVLVAAGTAAADLILVRTGHAGVVWPQGAITRRLQGTTWDDHRLGWVAVAVAAVGALLLLTALTPGRRPLAVLDDEEDATTFGASRRTLRRSLAAHVAAVDGVDRTRVRLRRGRARVRVTSAGAYRDEVRERVSAAAQAWVDDLTPARRPRIRVAVRRGGFR